MTAKIPSTMDFAVAHVNFSHGFRGGERQTELLIRGLADQGARQALLCRAESPLIAHLKDVERLTVIPLSSWPDIRLMGHLSLGSRAAVIQAHETLAAQWALLHYRFFEVPYVVTRRVDDAIRKNAFNAALYGKAAALVGVSSKIAAVVTGTFGVHCRTIHSACSKMGVDPHEAGRISAEFGGGFIIGHAGALVDRHKGQSTLIEAVRILKDKIPDLKLFFLGEGPDRAALEKRAAGLPVKFLGFKRNVTDYLVNFSVFAFPSNNEGLGSVLLDAMAAGVPVVASNVGGIPDLVENAQSGLLVPPGDPQSLAKAILSIHDSQELRSRLIAGGLKKADENSPEAMTSLYQQLYAEIAERN